MTQMPTDDQRMLGASQGNDGVLSLDKETAELELSFLRRVTSAFAAAGLDALSQAKDCEVGVEANLARMQHPLFRQLASALSASVPASQGFGKIGDRAKR